MLPRDDELNSGQLYREADVAGEFLSGSSAMRPGSGNTLGSYWGSDLYRAYLGRPFQPQRRPALFFRKPNTAAAREIYFATVGRARQRRSDFVA